MAAPQNAGPSSFRPNPSERKFPRLDTNKANDDVKALLSKLVPESPSRPKSPGGQRSVTVPSDPFIKKITDTTAAAVADSENLFQVLPDTDLVKQILVSSIISPKDMVKTSLTYHVEAGPTETELVGAMLHLVEEFFDKSYKIKKLMTPILEDVLFMTGSYPLLILPENSIDEAINSPTRVSIESLRGEMNFSLSTAPYGQSATLTKAEPTDLGFLGSPAPSKPGIPVPSLESLSSEARKAIEHVKFKEEAKFDPLIDVSDNPSWLKMRMLRDKMREDRIQDIISMRHTTARRSHKIAVEAQKKDSAKQPNLGETTAEVELSLYKKRKYKNVPVVAITPSDVLEKAPVGHPMVMKLPSESVIPVHVPGNPDEHIGYFIMLDQNGNPIVKAQMSDYYSDMTNGINANRDTVSSMIATTRNAQQGSGTPNDSFSENEVIKAYTDLVEEDLLNRLKNGIYGDDVEISKPQEVYRVMLARALKQMRTRLLYVPAELMTYIAFDFNRYGVGRSVLEKSRILGAMRAVMLFAATMQMIKNSVAREILNITLDPNDKDPTKTVEFMIHEYAKTRSAAYPIYASHPSDITGWLQSAGVSVAVSGNTGYPETKLEIEDKASNHTKPDTDLMNLLRDQHIMSMGLAPETVNQGGNVEFATTIVSSNLLLAKRVLQYQEKLVGFLEDHIQKYILYSGYLMGALRDVVSKHKSSVGDADKNVTGTPENSEDPDKTKNPGAQIITNPNKLDKERYGDDAVIIQFVKSIRVTLPAPDTIVVEDQLKAFTAYSEALDPMLAAYINPQMLDDATMGDLAPTVAATIAVVKAYYQRQWLRNNNVLPELEALTNIGSENDPFDLLEMQTGHMEGLMTAIGKFMKSLRDKLDEIKKKNDAAAGNTDTTSTADGTGEVTEPGAEPGATDELPEVPEEPAPIEEEPAATDETAPKKDEEPAAADKTKAEADAAKAKTDEGTTP